MEIKYLCYHGENSSFSTNIHLLNLCCQLHKSTNERFWVTLFQYCCVICRYCCFLKYSFLPLLSSNPLLFSSTKSFLCTYWVTNFPFLCVCDLLHIHIKLPCIRQRRCYNDSKYLYVSLCFWLWILPYFSHLSSWHYTIRLHPIKPNGWGCFNCFTSHELSISTIDIYFLLKLYLL